MIMSAPLSRGGSILGRNRVSGGRFKCFLFSSVHLCGRPRFSVLLDSSGIETTNRARSSRATPQFCSVLSCPVLPPPFVTIRSNLKRTERKKVIHPFGPPRAPNDPAVSDSVCVSAVDRQFTLSLCFFHLSPLSLPPCLCSHLPSPVRPSIRL